MTLLRLIQRASILAGMTLASLAVHTNPAHADDPQFCIVASNGKTLCGQTRGIERMCITTDGTNTICGKFKSFKQAGQAQGQEEARVPALSAGYRKEVDNFLLTLEGCKRVDEDVRCQMTILNKGKTRLVVLSAGGSSIVDSMGRSHAGSQTDFGRGLGSPSANMDANTDIVISIIFNKVPGQVSKAQLFNLAFGGAMKPVQFRNVPISN